MLFILLDLVEELLGHHLELCLELVQGLIEALVDLLLLAQPLLQAAQLLIVIGLLGEDHLAQLLDLSFEISLTRHRCGLLFSCYWWGSSFLHLFELTAQLLVHFHLLLVLVLAVLIENQVLRVLHLQLLDLL